MFLEVFVLFSFLLGFMAVSPLIGAILRLRNSARSVGFLCLGRGSHNYSYSRTTGQGSAPDTVPGWDHTCSGSSSRSQLRDQLRNRAAGLMLVHKVISGIKQTPGSKPKSGLQQPSSALGAGWK